MHQIPARCSGGRSGKQPTEGTVLEGRRDAHQIITFFSSPAYLRLGSIISGNREAQDSGTGTALQVKAAVRITYGSCELFAERVERSRQGILRNQRQLLKPLLESVPEVKPYSTGLFAGVLDCSKYSTPIKAMMKYKMWSKGVEEGNYRDWDAIHAWAEQLKPAILARAAIGR
jgi:hypothetical protein